MPISNEENWNKWVDNNKDPYGGCCVMVAKRVMEILDEVDEFDTHEIICQADNETKAGGITGFMAGAVATIVSTCHSRGDEFRRKWNSQCQIKDEGEKANEEGGILNPAILTVSQK